MEQPKPGTLFTAQESKCIWRELFSPKEAQLENLSASELDIRGTVSAEIIYKHQETLLFNLKDPVNVIVDGEIVRLEYLDVLYIPLGSSFSVDHSGGETGLINIYRARAENRHPLFHAKWKEFSNTESRIRSLKRKKVYLMFDVSEPSDCFMAGYTFYDTYSRAWPPHNHTDQEEVYSFFEGRGAMSVYPDEENQTFIREVSSGSHVTIPVMNYHPVFSHENPLAFIWCISGKRYWVGDKNKDFMTGKAKRVTT